MMSVKIIVGYLRLLQRVRQHYHLEYLSQQKAWADYWQQFSQALDQELEQGFDLHIYAQLLKQVQSTLARPVSLTLAEHATLQDVGLIGYLASTSLNLHQALSLLEQYYPLIFKQTNLEQLKIVEQQDLIQVSWSAMYQDYREIYELNQALIFKIAQTIAQQHLIPPIFIQLGQTPEFSVSYYEQFYGCHVSFREGQYSIGFPKQVLLARSFGADQHLNQVLSSQAQQTLQHVDTFEHRQQQLKQKMTGLIEHGLRHKNEIIQHYVAKQLHVSERTLQRQLKQHQLNFQEILDDFRLQHSQLYLKQGRSLTEIAELLGYADQSAFGRAFKRWTGQTPKNYRDDLHQDRYSSLK